MISWQHNINSFRNNAPKSIGNNKNYNITPSKQETHNRADDDCQCLKKIEHLLRQIFPIFDSNTKTLFHPVDDWQQGHLSNIEDATTAINYDDEYSSSPDRPFLNELIEGDLSHRYTRNRGLRSLPDRLGRDAYNILTRKLRTIERVAAKSGDHKPYHCLEVGCGEGRATYAFAQKFKQIQFTATDLFPTNKPIEHLIELELHETFQSNPAIIKNKALFNKLKATALASRRPYNFIQSDAMNLTSNLKAAMGRDAEIGFDVIFSMDAAPYMRDQVKAIYEIWKSLKIDGVAIFGTAPGYFNSLADELFPANSDASWSEDKRSIIIRRSRHEPDNLACLNYRWVSAEPEQFDLSAKESGDPLFLAFPKEQSQWHNDHPFPRALPATYQPLQDNRPAPQYALAFWSAN